MRAFDVESGAPRWWTDERIQGSFSTPTIWRHEARHYVLANADSGAVRLIDPREGSVVWTEEDLGPFLGTLSPNGDLVVLNAGSE